jgi:uncharacterized protein (DUF169 family)
MDMSDLSTISDYLKNTLGLKYTPVAVGLFDDAPLGVKTERPRLFCELLRKALKEGDTVYTTKDNRMCGAVELGFLVFKDVDQAVGIITKIHPGMYKTVDAQRKAISSTVNIPPGKKVVAVAPLNRAPFNPDLIMIVCNPKQATILTRAASYSDGVPVQGVAGQETCSVAIARPYVTGEVTFTVADVGGRVGMQLGDDEVIVTIPRRRLEDIVGNIETVMKWLAGRREGWRVDELRRNPPQIGNERR